MRSTFNVLFYVKKSQPKKNGLCPVMGRITIDGKAVQFSCKFDIDPKNWDVDAGRASGRSEQAREANRLLDQVGASLTKHYREIVNRDGYVSAEKVKNAYLGMDMRCETLLKVFARHNEDFEKMYQAGGRSWRTLYRYQRVYKLLEEFIKHRYNRTDIALKEIQPAFITDFELFLRTEKDCGSTTIWVYMMPLQRMITTAINNGWLGRNPFFEYSIKPEVADRGFLTKDEIKTLMETQFADDDLTLARDMFIFCCFTGFAYTDLYSMTIDNLQSSFDTKHQWLVKRRDKSNVSSTVPVLEIPMKILEKYKGLASGDKLLPAPCYPRAKYLLKLIEKECGLEKHITWHMSRHTYATEICLTNGVPIESLAKMLGHKNIRTTQIYAKITHEKLSRDADLLANRLNGIAEFKAASF